MYAFNLESGGVKVKLEAVFLGRDLQVWLTGGAAHIGAAAVAVPRPGLKNAGRISADASVVTVSGHKEDLLARELAIKLAAALNATVAVTAGLHWDNAGPGQIAMAEELSLKLADMLLADIGRESGMRAITPDKKGGN